MLRKKWVRAIFRQRIFVILLLVLQLAIVIYTFISSSLTSTIINHTLTILSVATSIYVLTRREDGVYKCTWIFLILIFPLFGGAFYCLSKTQSLARHFKKRSLYTEKKAKKLMNLPISAYDEAIERNPEYARQIRYLQDMAGFPIYDCTKTKYLSSGEVKFEHLLEELQKAEHYIFLEYFIIKEGKMWDSILEILKRKAAEGVTIRLLYDDFGCFAKLPKDYSRTLKSYGIESAIFNPFIPILTVLQNNRDHRKIAVIDGKVAFTGGVNLADKYINVNKDDGIWKDAAIMLVGKAAWSFTLMFLHMWELATKSDEDYMRWYPYKDKACDVVADGYVLPYFDSPLDKENIGENVYTQILANAKDYVYITTPYLIIDDKMVEAITVAAKSGVDVRIVTPHKAENWFVHTTTRSYYRELLCAGVKIYEYVGRNIHAKTFVSDDKIATVGTTNLDFRSLYLHFECGAWMCGADAVGELKEDFLTILAKSIPITNEDCDTNLFKRIIQDILRIFAPCM